MSNDVKGRMKRMLGHNVNHDVRNEPLKDITIYLSCGCSSSIMSDKNIAPSIGTKLYCFSHMCDVRVLDVEVRQWTP